MQDVFKAALSFSKYDYKEPRSQIFSYEHPLVPVACGPLAELAVAIGYIDTIIFITVSAAYLYKKNIRIWYGSYYHAGRRDFQWNASLTHYQTSIYEGLGKFIAVNFAGVVRLDGARAILPPYLAISRQSLPTMPPSRHTCLSLEFERYTV